MSKSLFLIHPRQSYKADLTDLGLDIDNIDEETLESFCPSLTTDLLPVKSIQLRGGQK